MTPALRHRVPSSFSSMTGWSGWSGECHRVHVWISAKPLTTVLHNSPAKKMVQMNRIRVYLSAGPKERSSGEHSELQAACILPWWPQSSPCNC